MKKTFFFACLSVVTGYGYTQVPDTEIFLSDIQVKDGKFFFSQPVNITRHKGYDNQPWFSSDSRTIMYVSMPDTSQTDIYQYNIKDSTTSRITESPESEYSPRFTQDGEITMVRVDADKAQRLYQTAGDDLDNLTPGLDSIGYYLQINDSVIALASLNNGMELYIYERSNGQYIVLEKGIGRCLLKDPASGDLVYTKKQGDEVMLYRLTLPGEDINIFCTGLKGVDDYAFMPDGTLLAGDNGKLMAYSSKNNSWQEVSDFSKTAGNFYRLVVSPDGKRLALVSYKGKKP